MLQTLLRSTPIWLFGILIMAGCVLASEFGRYLHRRRGTRTPAAKNGDDGYIVAAIFSLLAFMISVTFSIASDRFDAKRALVGEEANAITTSYQRASMLDEPGRSRVHAILRDYARSRIALERIPNTSKDRVLVQSRMLQRALWIATLEACYPIRTTSLASNVVQAVSETLDVGSQRELARSAFVPSRVLLTLILYLFVASSLLGYRVDSSSGQRRALGYVLFVLYTAAIVLIADLDSPLEGSVKVPQTALKQVAANLEFGSASDKHIARPLDSVSCHPNRCIARHRSLSRSPIIT